MPTLFIFQYNKYVAGKEHPAVYLLSAPFKNKDRAERWADKMQEEARECETSKHSSTFGFVPANWNRPKNLRIPKNTNLGQATIKNIKKLCIQQAR